MKKKLWIGALGLVPFAAALHFHEADMPSAMEFQAPSAATESVVPGKVAGNETIHSRHASFTLSTSLDRLLERIKAGLKSHDPAEQVKLPILLGELVRSNPQAAARFAESLEAGEMREKLLRMVTQCWAAHDAAGAESWAARWNDESERKAILTDLCFQIAQINAAQALQKAEQYQLGTMPGAVLENLAQQWARQDFSSATLWIRARPTGEQREQMLWRLAIVQSETAPAQAARLVVEQIPAGPIQTEAVISVLHQWAARDMAEAKAWVELFPAGPLRSRSENELSNMAAYHKGSNSSGKP